MTLSSGGELRLRVQIGDNERTVVGSLSTKKPGQVLFDYVVQAEDIDEDGVSVEANALELHGGTLRDSNDTDASLTLGALEPSADHRVNAPPPAITGIDLGPILSANQIHATGDEIEVTVTFSEPVTLSGGDLSLGLRIGDNERTLTASSVSEVTEVPFTYTVTDEDVDTDGVLVAPEDPLTLGPGATLVDSDALDAVLTHAEEEFPGHVVNPPPVTVTGIAISPDSDPGGDGVYTSGETILVDVSFSAGVSRASPTAAGPTLALDVGGAARAASFSAGAGGESFIRFAYPVTGDDVDTNGVHVPANALSLPTEEQLVDRYARDAELTHGVFGPFGHPINPPVTISDIGVTSSPDNGEFYTTGEPIELTVTFTEVLTSSGGTPTLTLSLGGAARTAGLVAGSGTKMLTFRHVVLAADRDTDGVLSVPAGALTLPLGATLRAAGNRDAVLTLDARSLSAHKVNPWPDAPQTFAAVPAPTTTPQVAIALSWTAPTSDGGSAITKHQYRYKSGSGAFGDWTDILDSAVGETNATGYTVTGLTATNPPTTFTFEVRAVNANGHGAASGQESATVDVPASILPTLTAGNVQITAQWTTPANNGSAILRYQYWVSDATNQIEITPYTDISGSNASTTSHTVTGLSNGIAYIVAIRAVNSVGHGANNLPDTVIPGTIPSAPRTLGAEVGDGQVRLHWTAPASDGGNTITGYEYQQKTGTNAFGARTNISGADENTTEHTVIGLTNGTAYTFRVRALNPMGEGPASNQVSVTPVTVPSVPQSVTVNSGDGKVILQWFPPRLGGGTPILRYEYRLDAESFGNSWIPILDSAPGEANHGRYEIERANGTYTIVYLRAVNKEGAGAEVQRGTMPFAGAPGPPGNFRATLISEDEFELSWTAPAAVPGVTITGYIIDASPDGVTDWEQHTYDITVPGTTSLTGRIGRRTGYFRIRTQFQVDPPTVVDGTEFSSGMSETSPVVGLGTGETTVDPALPQVRVWDAFAREGRDPAVVFTVRLHPAATSTVTVDYRTEDITATAPDDYQATSGTLIFAPGETEQTVSVPVVDDDVEDSGESFALLLSNVSGARLGDEGAAGVIDNEEDVLAGFALVDAASGTDVGSLADGTEVTLDDPANGRYGIVARAAPDMAIGSVRLALTGAKAVTHTDDAAPFSLFGDTDGKVQGEALPAGSYSLTATAYAGADGGGEALQTLAVSFAVVDGEFTPATAALTAGLEEIPGAHDGTAFTIRARFSEPVSSDAAEMAAAFAVTGGTATAARVVDGDSALWEIDVEPASRDDVSLELAADQGCDVGGICTADGRALSNTTSAVVAGPGEVAALSATFPASPYASRLHKGAGDRPQVVVAFSEAVASFAANTPSAQGAGGTINSVQAHTEDGLANAWIFFLTPDGNGAVTFTLVADAAGGANNPGSGRRRRRRRR